LHLPLHWITFATVFKKKSKICLSTKIFDAARSAPLLLLSLPSHNCFIKTRIFVFSDSLTSDLTLITSFSLVRCRVFFLVMHHNRKVTAAFIYQLTEFGFPDMLSLMKTGFLLGSSLHLDWPFPSLPSSRHWHHYEVGQLAKQR
jgi:hypothetical protein